MNCYDGKSVLIIGAGVVGLNTALRLQKVLPKSTKITLISERFSPDTTGNVAAGIFKPADKLKVLKPNYLNF